MFGVVVMLFWLVDRWMLGYFGSLMLRFSDWLLGCCLDVLGDCYIVAKMFRLVARWLVRVFWLVARWMLQCFGLLDCCKFFFQGGC